MMTPNELYDILYMNILTDGGEHYNDDYYTNFPFNFFSELMVGHKDVEVCTGATKICLVPADGDFVFKINIVDECTDYCKDEADNYMAAVNAGKDKYFLETRYFKTLNECGVCFAIYIQPKIEEISSDIDKDELADDELIEELLEKSSWYSSPATEDMSPIWANNFIKEYGETEFNELLAFCDRYYINDLHSSNIGYVGGRPVIFDYAGYGDCTTSSWEDSSEY